jgi:hypothetical protein
VEEAAVSTFVGSSELGRWGNGGATERDDRRRSVLSGGALWCGRGELVRCGITTVVQWRKEGVFKSARALELGSGIRKMGGGSGSRSRKKMKKAISRNYAFIAGTRVPSGARGVLG